MNITRDTPFAVTKTFPINQAHPLLQSQTETLLVCAEIISLRGKGLYSWLTDMYCPCLGPSQGQ